MSDSPQAFTGGWKITIIGALLIALANGGISGLRDRENDRFKNHEARMDELENLVFGNDIGTAPRENSLTNRIESLEKQLDAIEERIRKANPE